MYMCMYVCLVCLANMLVVACATTLVLHLPMQSKQVHSVQCNTSDANDPVQFSMGLFSCQWQWVCR